MNINPLVNPLLWLGALTFTNSRLDLYETLAESLDDRASASPMNLRATFEKWAARDAARMEPRHLVYSNIARRLSQGGISFAQALRPFIPNEEFLILSSGEIKGDLKTAIRLVVRNIEATQSMQSSVGEAMAQPLIGGGSLLLLSFGFGKWLWPDFLRSVNRQFWPGWTLYGIDFQIWLATHWWTLLSIGIVAILYYTTLDRWTGRSRNWFDHIPPWSIYKGRQSSNLLGILSALVSAGRTVRESLVLVRDSSTPYMRWHLNRVIRRYDASGEDAMAAMRTGLFSRPVLDRIEDAAANRTFDKTLAHIGETSLRMIVRVVHKQAQIASTIFMVVVGLAFLYNTAISVFGMQDATDAFLRAMGGGVVQSK